MENSIKTALIQTSLIWHDPPANRTHFDRILANLEGEIDLVVLPEMFSTGFTMEPEAIAEREGTDTISWMSEKAKQLNSALCGSIVFKDGNNHYNRFCFCTPEGDVFTYDKRHTFTLAGEDKVYKRGEERVVIDYGGFKICPMICYDLRFPVWSRNTDDYDIILYVANWPSVRVSAWDTLLKARAIENMAYCIGVNRTGSDANGHAYPGHSAVYDALGEAIVFQEEEGILYAELNKEHLTETRQKLKFLQDRDNFSFQL